MKSLYSVYCCLLLNVYWHFASHNSSLRQLISHDTEISNLSLRKIYHRWVPVFNEFNSALLLYIWDVGHIKTPENDRLLGIFFKCYVGMPLIVMEIFKRQSEFPCEINSKLNNFAWGSFCLMKIHGAFLLFALVILFYFTLLSVVYFIGCLLSEVLDIYKKNRIQHM